MSETTKKLRRWTKSEMDEVLSSTESAESLAVRLGRTRRAVENVRRRASLTANDIKNDIHEAITRHANELTDEIDALLGLFSSDKGYAEARGLK